MGEERKDSYVENGAIQIGSTLKRSRQELGLSFEDVERETNIRQRYLEALEREDYGALPGAVYAQGFLKTYANYLNLDGEELSQELKNQWEVLRERESNDSAPPRRSSGTTPHRARSSRGSRPRRRPFPTLALGVAVLAIVVLAVGVGGLYMIGQRAMQTSGGPGAEAPANSEPAPDAVPENNNSPSEENGAGGEDQQNEEPEPAAPDDNPQDAGGGQTPEDEEPGVAAPGSPDPDKLTMAVRVDGNVSWLNIQTDGNVVYEQVAEPGFTRTFEAEEKITVWSGNAGAVLLEVNGQDYGPLGESGETKLQDFELKAAENQ